MSKIWIRNVITNDINKVGSLSYGSEMWEKAYSEMIKKGYKFEIGNPRGNYEKYYGLYLINPLDIQIAESKYDVVNRINEMVKEIQDIHNRQKTDENKNTEEYSLDELFKRLEGAYKRASNISDIALMMAPPEAIDYVVENQKKAYNQFIEALKESSSEERKSYIEIVKNSRSLIDNAKLAIIVEILNSFDNIIIDRNIEVNEELNKSLRNLEYVCNRAANISGTAIMMVPPEAIDYVVEDQEKAYNQFIEVLKSSTLDDQKNIIRRVLNSRKLIDNVKLAIVLEIISSLEELKMENEETIQGGINR